MSVSETVSNILSKKDLTKRALADGLNTTEQNLYNKMKRDNFTAKELVEIGLTLNLKLSFIDTENGDQYDIEYNKNELFKPKRKNKSE